MRCPSSSYWPPWHGQANPMPCATATGHPRCMHRFENTMNMASVASQSGFDFPVLWTQARPGLVAGLSGILDVGRRGGVEALLRRELVGLPEEHGLELSPRW